MKLAKLNILIKSSVKTRKLSSAFFCIFVILSTVLMLLSIGLILPMTDNVVNKINNHISRRELETDFTDNIPDDYIESKITRRSRRPAPRPWKRARSQAHFHFSGSHARQDA